MGIGPLCCLTIVRLIGKESPKFRERYIYMYTGGGGRGANAD